MAYVPLYGRITDNQGGCSHSLCLRGRVDNIGFWLNSWFGEVCSISARLIDGSQIISKPDLRKIKKEKRTEAKVSYEEEKEEADKVVLDINIPPNKKFDIRLNGISISYDRLKLLHDMQMKRMDMQIASLQKMMKKEKDILQIAEMVTNG